MLFFVDFMVPEDVSFESALFSEIALLRVCLVTDHPGNYPDEPEQISRVIVQNGHEGSETAYQTPQKQVYMNMRTFGYGNEIAVFGYLVSIGSTLDASSSTFMNTFSIHHR
jgi:hypothetical protein